MNPYTPTEKTDLPVSLRHIEKLTYLMDRAFVIPGTSFRFGLDPLLGLVPGIGDTISLLVSGVLLVAMVRHGVSGVVLARMLGNLALDYTVGVVPLLGNIFDFSFKANQRNLSLLKSYYQTLPEDTSRPSFWKALGQIALVIAGVVVLIGGLMIGLLLALF
ncbi:MAG: DUF4112 domain-containing protein [Bernardetiaceae bacterium]